MQYFLREAVRPVHFDHLDESYTMVESNLHFDKVTLISLTGLYIPIKPVCTTILILVVNMPIKSLYPKHDH